MGGEIFEKKKGIKEKFLINHRPKASKKNDYCHSAINKNTVVQACRKKQNKHIKTRECLFDNKWKREADMGPEKKDKCG